VISKEVMKKIDSQNMFKIYDTWDELAKKYYERGFEQIDFKNIDHIVFAGMGGSGTIGDIFSSILSKDNIHVSVIKGYQLPKTVDVDTLVVTTSVSGNTDETVNILKNAHKENFKTISFSSGGEIEKYCNKNNLEFRNIPLHHSPRASLIPYLYSILNIMNTLLPIKNSEVLESISKLKIMKKQISSANLSKNNKALLLAEELSGIPLIYYPHGLQSTAIRFKNSLQENTKIHAITEDVIESCHNGVVAWERSSNVMPILLQGDSDHIKTQERWNVFKKYFNEQKIDYKEVYSVSGNILTKITNLIYFLDYTSIYRAILSKIDPTPVKSINYIKENLLKNNL
jgi:glucose/mannose-6-phosphate isomerase